MKLLEWQLLLAMLFGVVSLLLMAVLVVLRVRPSTRAAIVASVPTVLFGAAILALVAFGLYYS